MGTVRADPYDVHLVPLARFTDGTPVNVVVLRSADAVYLVDAGAGPVARWGPCPGVPEDALGVDRPTGIVLTHWDWDHSGGLVDGTWGGDLAPRYPGVPVHVLDEELPFWRSRSDGEEASNCGTAVLAVLESAGLLRPVAAGVELAPGIRLEGIPGHSPGQAMVVLGDGSVVFGADLVHEAIHVQRPEDDHEYDHDAALGLETRRRVLPRLAASGARVAFTHVDGWGRVVDDDGGLRWQPEEA
jgi:glyoxylase-like metal-dependent hydrolase (beta-lactamase superfamily II)